MRIVILFALLAATQALPTPERVLLTREELDAKANEVEEFLDLLDEIKRIALTPRDENDWEQPESNARDIEAFLATLELLNNMVEDTDADGEIKHENEKDFELFEEFLDIINHLKSWVLATGGDMEQLDTQSHYRDYYTAVLSLVEDIENYVSDEARKNKAFIEVLHWLRGKALTTGGNWQNLDDIKENNKETLQTVLKVINGIEKFVNPIKS